jgi:SAM-dependent methyltransferase
VTIHPSAAVGFASAADVYERARPSYPQEAIDWLAERTGLGAGRTVVDLGAGTGKLTRLLIPLPDASADVVTAAQAFHWFDHDRALPEIHRVLREGGALVLVWNMRDLDDPLQRGVEDLLRFVRDETPGQQLGAWREPLARSELFEPAEVREFGYEQRFTTEELCERVASTSFVAAMRPIDREELLVRVRALTHGVEEPFPFPYKTEVEIIPRSSDRGGEGRGTSIKG